MVLQRNVTHTNSVCSFLLIAWQSTCLSLPEKKKKSLDMKLQYRSKSASTSSHWWPWVNFIFVFCFIFFKMSCWKLQRLFQKFYELKRFDWKICVASVTWLPSIFMDTYLLHMSEVPLRKLTLFRCEIRALGERR